MLDKLGYDAANGDIPVMVGDHANDINAARSANTHAIAVAFEVDATKAKSLNADAVVTDYRDLLTAIKEITSLPA